MKNVKRTFFLTKEEAEQQQKVMGISNIDYNSPHYQLEDDSIIWGVFEYVSNTRISKHRVI